MFNLSLFLTKTISFATLHTSLICMVLIPFIKSCNFGAVELSFILSVKKFTRIFTDVPFGIIFDKFGAKTVFFLGRILKLASFFILLLEPTFITFVIAMLFDGMSYSAIYGKVNAYIYNVLSANGILSKYQKAASIYYFVMDVVLSSASFVAAVLLKSHGYKILIYISIVMNLVSLIILIFITEENVTNRDSSSYKSASVVEMCKTLVYLFKTNRIIIWLLLFYGFCNFIAWQFGVIATMVLMDMNYTASEVTFVASAAKIVMAIGCLFPMFGFKKGISMKNSVLIFTIFVFIGLLSAILYNDKIFLFFNLGIIAVYTLVEISVEKTFEGISDRKLRGTVIAIGWFFCSVMAICSIMTMGFLAKFLSYKTGFLIIMSIILLLHLLIIKPIKNYDFSKHRI